METSVKVVSHNQIHDCTALGFKLYHLSSLLSSGQCHPDFSVMTTGSRFQIQNGLRRRIRIFPISVPRVCIFEIF